MPTPESRLTAHAPAEPSHKQSAPLTRTVTSKTKAQERAERNLLKQRQAWNIEEIVAGQAADTLKPKAGDEEPQWTALLNALNRHSVSSWTALDKALAPFFMGASGPMNPRTGQYLTEIRMVRDHDQQVERVTAGIETLLPFLKLHRGAYEFRIKCQGASTRDKNWLSLSKDGKARVVSSVRPEASFDDLQILRNF
jgi:hypothetical protein